MITISKSGWMENSISYARIGQIAYKAREAAIRDSARQEPLAQLEQDQEYHPDMWFGERLYDYVLCGSSKHEFMRNLYLMSRKTAESGLPRVKSAIGPSDEHRYVRRGPSMDELENSITSLLSGNSLKFEEERYIPGHQSPETFLVYRDYARRTAFGLSINYQSDGMRPKHSASSAVTHPKYDRPEQIQLCHLKEIEKSGGLVCGNQTYVVRFMKNREPIVIRTEESRQATLLQKRLLNMWVIDNLRTRVIDFRHAPYAQQKLDANSIYSHWMPSCFNDGMPIYWNVGSLFQIATEKLERNLKTEGEFIIDKLENIASMSNPGWSDLKAFIKLREQVARLENVPKIAQDCIHYTKLQMEKFFLHGARVKDAETLKLFKSRLQRFHELTTQFIRSDIDELEAEKFKKQCEAIFTI